MTRPRPPPARPRASRARRHRHRLHASLFRHHPIPIPRTHLLLLFFPLPPPRPPSQPIRVRAPRLRVRARVRRPRRAEPSTPEPQSTQIPVHQILFPRHPASRQQRVHRSHTRRFLVRITQKQRQTLRLDEKRALLGEQPRRVPARAPESVNVSPPRAHHLGARDFRAPHGARKRARARASPGGPRVARRLDGARRGRAWMRRSRPRRSTPWDRV